MRELGYGKREEGVPREVDRITTGLISSFCPQNSKESNSSNGTGTAGSLGTTPLNQNESDDVRVLAGRNTGNGEECGAATTVLRSVSQFELRFNIFITFGVHSQYTQEGQIKQFVSNLQ